MSIKEVRFGEKDADLVKKIKEYQREHQYSSFIDAVRSLCYDALQFKKLVSK